MSLHLITLDELFLILTMVAVIVQMLRRSTHNLHSDGWCTITRMGDMSD